MGGILYCPRGGAQMFSRVLSLIKPVSHYYLPRPMDSRHLPRQHDQASVLQRLVNEEHALCTTCNRLIICPEPCPRSQSQLIVPTFELIPTSSRGVLPGVSEPSRITPRGRNFDVTFVMTGTCICGDSWAKHGGVHRPYPGLSSV